MEVAEIIAAIKNATGCESLKGIRNEISKTAREDLVEMRVKELRVALKEIREVKVGCLKCKEAVESSVKSLILSVVERRLEKTL